MNRPILLAYFLLIFCVLFFYLPTMQVDETVDLSNQWETYQLVIPKERILASNATFITFIHAKHESANQQSGEQSPDTRPLGSAYAWLTIQPVEK